MHVCVRGGGEGQLEKGLDNGGWAGEYREVSANSGSIGLLNTIMLCKLCNLLFGERSYRGPVVTIGHIQHPMVNNIA